MENSSTNSVGFSKVKYENASEGTGISTNVYNLIMGGMILYGIIINIVMCMTCTKLALSINPIVLFVGYNIIVVPMGLILSVVVQAYGGVSSAVVMQAFLYTGIITGIMILLSIAFPKFFSKIGGMLFGCLIGMIIAYIIVWILHIDTIIIAYFGAVLFSLYIGYDIWRSQQLPHTVGNAVASACEIYVDIVNLFLRLLEILGHSSKN